MFYKYFKHSIIKSTLFSLLLLSFLATVFPQVLALPATWSLSWTPGSCPHYPFLSHISFRRQAMAQWLRRHVVPLHAISESLALSLDSNPNSSFLAIHTLTRQEVTAQAVGSLPSTWRPRLSSWCLISAWPSPGHCKHLGEWPMDRILLAMSVLVYLSNKLIKKIK